MYKDNVVKEVYDDFFDSLAVSEKMTVEKLENVNIFKKLLRIILKIFSPLM